MLYDCVNHVKRPRQNTSEGIFIPGIIKYPNLHITQIVHQHVCNVLQTNFVLGSCLFYQMKITLLHVSNIMQCTVYVHIYAVIFISILVLFCNFPLFSGNEQHIFKIIFENDRQTIVTNQNLRITIFYILFHILEEL